MKTYTYNQTVRYIQKAAALVRRGGAETVFEAYTILDGRELARRIENNIPSIHKRSYEIGHYKDNAYTKQLVNKASGVRVSDDTSIAQFVTRTINWFAKPKNEKLRNLKEAIY